MYAQVWPHRLGSAFGDGYRRGAKTGTLPAIRNESGVVECPDGRRFAVLVSHADETLTLQPALAAGKLATLDGTDVVDTVTMGPFGINVFMITGK